MNVAAITIPPVKRPNADYLKKHKLKSPVTGPKAKRLLGDTSYISTGMKAQVFAMLKLGFTHEEAARRSDLPLTTINKLARDRDLLLMDDKVMAKTKELLGHRFYNLADMALQQAGDDFNMAQMNSYQATIMAGIAFDKGRLAENLPTANVTVRGIVNHLHEEGSRLDAAIERVSASLAVEAEVIETGDVVPDSGTGLPGSPLPGPEIFNGR